MVCVFQAWQLGRPVSWALRLVPSFSAWRLQQPTILSGPCTLCAHPHRVAPVPACMLMLSFLWRISTVQQPMARSALLHRLCRELRCVPHADGKVELALSMKSVVSATYRIAAACTCCSCTSLQSTYPFKPTSFVTDVGITWEIFSVALFGILIGVRVPMCSTDCSKAFLSFL
jgi:hypothetical protein